MRAMFLLASGLLACAGSPYSDESSALRRREAGIGVLGEDAGGLGQEEDLLSDPGDAEDDRSTGTTSGLGPARGNRADAGADGGRSMKASDARATGGAGLDGGASADASAGEAGPLPDASAADAARAADASAKREVTLPPANAKHDYQLGDAYEPPTGVRIVSRDHDQAPVPGLYNICYVNGFQTQAEERRFWLEKHPELLLRESNGEPVVDEEWNELLFDVRDPQKREQLASIVGEWIEGCARAGFDAVEIDNLDSYSRSYGLLNAADSVRFLAKLSAIAHEHGLAIAQKNASELASRRAELGTDFAIAEECNRYDECDTYVRAYGDRVLVVEYQERDFDRGCARYPNLSITLRDQDLVGPSSSGYVFEGC